MQAIEMRSRLGILVGLVLLATPGCVTSSAPSGWLPSAKEAQTEAFGGWIEVEVQVGTGASAGTTATITGELIAVHPDTVHVLSEPGLKSFAKSDIAGARLFRYSSERGVLSIWTLLGTLSTASHGVILIISAPVWVIAGSIATSAQSRLPVVKHPNHSWGDLAAFARFPQGLPAHVAAEPSLLRFKR